MANAPDSNKLSVFLSAMAVAAVIPLYTQFKGFSLHMLPVISLLIPAAATTLLLHLSQAKAINARTKLIAAACSCFGLFEEPCNHVHKPQVAQGLA